MQQTSAQATSTKAKNRPESRSQRTYSRLKQLSHDSARSTFHRCRPRRADDSSGWVDLAAVLAAMDSGDTYVNVHTNDGVAPPNTGPGDFPAGEIRGQIR